ncbi:MAG TPA: class I SAM-dependent methyltransferase [Prolixibacteraceae bacterium]|nr:class I SAM-dependent methyltransferase [Prolixibacteraceae bacterium]
MPAKRFNIGRMIGNQFRKPSGLIGKVVSRRMVKGNVFEYSRIIPYMDIQPDDEIFEIGYGHGMGIQMIRSKYDCRLTGVDFSKLMYREASQRNRKAIAEGKVKLEYGNFLEYDMLPAAYDRIFCTNVVYFWERLDEPFAKIYSGLKKGGLFTLFMVGPESLEKVPFTEGVFYKHSIGEVFEKLTQAGFQQIEQFFDVGYFIRCRK